FLGLSHLNTQRDHYSDLARIALDKMAVKKLSRIGMKFQVFLQLKMTHPELFKLMFGTFLTTQQDIERLCGKVDDGLVQLHGTRGGLKLILIVAPVTVEQATNWFMAIPNLEHFLEPKLIDTGVKDFKDRVSEESLLLDIDLFRMNADLADIPFFLSNSL